MLGGQKVVPARCAPGVADMGRPRAAGLESAAHVSAVESTTARQMSARYLSVLERRIQGPEMAA